MQIQKLMGRFVPLNELKAENLETLAKSAKAIKLPRGDLVFDFGDTSPYSYYLLQGDLVLTTSDGAQISVRADDPRAAYPVGNLLPRQLRAGVSSESAWLLEIGRSELEREVVRTGGMGSGISVLELEALPEEQRELTLAVLNTPLLGLLPKPNARALLPAFQGKQYRKGDVVIRQGDPGDYFYLMLSGACSVTREAFNGSIEINHIQAPDGFGDEALITGEPRGATVTMESDGMLLRLEHSLFHEHLFNPLIHHIPWDSGLHLATSGKARIIDVRNDLEFAQERLPKALHIPMYMLYLKSRALNKQLHYLIHGDYDKYSQAAAFLLARRGLKVNILGSRGRVIGHSIAEAMILPGAADF